LKRKRVEMLRKIREMVLNNERDLYLWMFIAEESQDEDIYSLALAVRNYLLCKKGIPKKMLEEILGNIENEAKNEEEKQEIIKLKKVLFS